MDLDVLTIAKRGSLGVVILRTHETTIGRLVELKALVDKIEHADGFTLPEKEQSRIFALVSAISFLRLI